MPPSTPESADHGAPKVLAVATSRAMRELIDRQIERLRALGRGTHDEALARAATRVARLLAENAPAAADFAEGSSADDKGRTSLEALIKLTGRPALRVQNDRVNVTDPEVGDWQAPLVLIQAAIPDIVRAVGRIDMGAAHVGTGFLIADDLVMTNRHVLDALTIPGATINFKCEAGSTQAARFRVLAVEFAGSASAGTAGVVHFGNLDLAILRIDTNGEGDRQAPAPLPLLRGALDTHMTEQLFVVGFPAAPQRPPRDAAGQLRQDVAEALMRIFGVDYGVKYLSPGETLGLPGALEGDSQRWVFSHDATTLGGNSGSCVVRLGHRPAVIGLHFAGAFETANYAHALARVIESGRLPNYVAEHLRWVEE